MFPSEIVGKRIRVKLDSSRLIKVHLDKAQQNNVEHKVSFKAAEASACSGNTNNDAFKCQSLTSVEGLFGVEKVTLSHQTPPKNGIYYKDKTEHVSLG